MLLIHIASATVSLIFASYTAFFPSSGKIKFTYFLTVMTLISGGILSLSADISLGRVCLLGAFYILLTISSVIVAKRRMVALPTLGRIDGYRSAHQ